MSDKLKVCSILNDYFASVAKDIGKSDELPENDDINDIVNKYENHDSVQYISTRLRSGTKFSFSMVTEDIVIEKLVNLNVKKANGLDNIPPKLLKNGANILWKPLCRLINQSIKNSSFPNNRKMGELTPLFKKGNSLETKTYRPISVLTCMSKVFESIFTDQLIVIMDVVCGSATLH